MNYKSQYISNGDTAEEQLHHIKSALDAGQRWIQFRFKKANDELRYKTAEKTKLLCDNYGAILIINDHIEIAKSIDAHGVHLGLTDTPIEIARKHLKNKIIGGTANTLEQVLQRHNEGCDYIGLGPFTYTNTKEKLSPILGIDTYKTILQKMKEADIKTPLVAIGGIQLKDIEPILSTGVQGIAFSSLFEKAKNKKEIIQQINNIIYESI